MDINKRFEWEWIEEGFLARAKVPWGWLIRAYENVFHPSEVNYPDQYGTGYDYRVSICFIFDPFHWWRIKK